MIFLRIINNHFLPEDAFNRGTSSPAQDGVFIMQNSKVLIIGASGVVGSEIVKLLRADGVKVRTTTSKPTPVSKGDSEQVHVNLQTGEGLRQAFDGIDRAFLISPAGYADQYSTLAPQIQEAKRRGLKKVVLMTAMGANAVETSPMRRAEIDLETSGLSYNIIRPNWFLQNFHTFWIQGILAHGKIMLPAGKAKVSFVDTRDVAAVAAQLLMDDTRNNRAFDLTGSEAIDHAQVAKEISRVTGKTITYEEIDPQALRAGLIGAGLSADYSDFLLLIFGALRDGYSGPVTNHVKDIIGRAPLSLKTYAEDHKSAWL